MNALAVLKDLESRTEGLSMLHDAKMRNKPVVGRKMFRIPGAEKGNWVANTANGSNRIMQVGCRVKRERQKHRHFLFRHCKLAFR